MTCVFLDRDGVINHSNVINGKPYAPTRFEEFKIIDGVAESLSIIKENKFKISIFTNQPDVKLKKEMKKEVIKMHEFLLRTLPIDHIDVCFHNNEDNCLCRKPKIGMFRLAQKKWNIDKPNSFMIGDQITDIKFAKKANIEGYFFQEKNLLKFIKNKLEPVKISQNQN